MNPVIFTGKHKYVMKEKKKKTITNKNHHRFEIPERQLIFFGFLCILFLYTLQGFAVFSTSFPDPTFCNICIIFGKNTEQKV